MKVIFLIMCLSLFGCSFLGKNNAEIKDNLCNKTCERDKEQISKCFIENIEYYRKYHRYDKKIYVNSPEGVKKEHQEYYKKHPGADQDPANFFEPYATRFSLEKDDYVSSPKPTETQLSVKTDTIIYSSDSLFCIAFLVIELHYDDIEGLENARDKNRRFDGNVIIGYRINKNDLFQIYPVKNHFVTGFESYQAVAKNLDYFFFNKLKGTSLGGIYRGTKFKQNVGDKDFFTKSPFFQKRPNGLYNFQMYVHLGKESEYNYQSCK